MVTMAKGVASGYAAIACLVTTEEVFDSFKDNPSDKMNYFGISLPLADVPLDQQQLSKTCE